MTYAQIIEKRNKLMHDAGALAQGKKVDGETRAKVTAMLAEADELAEDASNAQRLEAHADELRSAGRPPRGEIGATDTEREKRDFTNWMRTGSVAEGSSLREARDLGSFTGGGVASNTISSSVLIPVGFDPQLSIAAKSYGELVGAVRSLVTSTGEPQKYVLVDDTANSLTLLATENTAVTELDPGLAGGVSYVDDLTTSLIKVSNNLINDSAFDVSAFIQDTFAARYYKGLAQMIQAGNSSHIAAITANVPIGATTLANNAIVLDDIVATFSALNPAYLGRASWVVSPTVRTSLFLLRDTQGRPILQDAAGVPFSVLYGRPLVISTYAPTIAASTANVMLFGDLSSYTLRTVGNLEIVRLAERYAEFNECGFIGRVRAGGYSTLQASSPAIVGLKMHA